MLSSRFRVVLCLLVLIPGGVCSGDAQTKPEDELVGRLAAARGSERVRLLDDLATRVCLRDPAAAIEYASEAVTLAHKLEDRKGEGVALKVIGVAYAVTGQQHTSIEYSQQALAIFQQLDEPRELGMVLNNLGIAYRMLNDAEQAITFYEQALAIDQELSNDKGVARALSNIANVYFDQSEYDKALSFHQQSLDIERELGDDNQIASCLNNIGTVYFEQGKLEQALDNFLESLAIRERLGDSADVTGLLFNIANIKADLGLYDEARTLYERSLANAERVGNRADIGHAHNAIGYLLTYQDEHQQALEHYQLAYEHLKAADDRSGVADALDNIGICERAFGNLETALEHHREALQIREEIGGQRAIANTCNNIGRLQTELGRPAQALPWLERARSIAEEIDASEILRDATWHLSRQAVAVGDFERAVRLLEEHGRIKDRLLDEHTRDALAEAEARYQAARRQQEIALLSKENQIKDLEVARARLQSLVILLVLVVTLVLVGWLLVRYRSLLVFWKHKSHVGHYRLIDQLGSGGMGIVYRAENVVGRARRTFALKVIRQEHAGDETLRKRFLHEAAIVDQLAHPHIVAVHERGEHEGQLFMAMELLEGPSLAELIRQATRLSLANCLHIMAQLVEVVSRLHDKGVLHRDLKPENVMLVDQNDDPYFVKLLDFGLARTQSLTHLTETGMIVGTIGYLPPEQITEQRCTAAGDIWALGVIFYELLTLQPPFPGDTPVDVIKQILDVTPVPPSRFYPEAAGDVDQLVSEMMDKNPGNRPDEAMLVERLTALQRQLAERLLD